MKTLAIFVALVLAFGMTHGAFAHKSQIVGDYEIEVGWQNEPTFVGHENAITIMITNAPQDEHDEEMHDEEMHDEEMHDEEEAEHDHEEGISGLGSSLEAYITLNGKQTDLEFVEDSDTPGLYIAKYTPSETGHPVVHLVATINDEVFEIDFHPEKVKVMSPLEQQNEGVPPNEVECSNDKVLMFKTNDGSAICVTQITAEKLLARNWAKYF